MILSVGAANIDEKWILGKNWSPATSNPARIQSSFGGVARNIAENLGRLGTKVELLTAVGQQAEGQALLAHAQAAGVSTQHVLQLASPTGRYCAILDEAGELVLGLNDMSALENLPTHFWQQAEELAKRATLCVFDLNLPKAPLQHCISSIRKQHQQVAVVLVAVSAPKMNRLPDPLEGVDVLIVNQDEWSALAELHAPTLAGFANPYPTHPLGPLWSLLVERGLQHLVVTRGAKGVDWCSAKQAHELVHHDAPPVNVVDVTGAGDAFSAGFCFAWHTQPGNMGRAVEHGLALSRLTLQSLHSVCPDLQPQVFATIAEG